MKGNQPTQKEAQALALRRAGKTYIEIGRIMDCGPGNAKQFADKALLKELRRERDEFDWKVGIA